MQEKINESGGVDLSGYEGKKIKIAGLEAKTVTGMEFDKQNKAIPGTEHDVQRLRVFSEPVGETITTKDGTEVDVTASDLFNVSITKDDKPVADGVLDVTDEDLVITYSDSENASIQKLMKKLGVTTITDLIGKEILMQLDDKNFLRFIYK